MTAWERRSLAVLLLMLVAISSLLNLVVTASTRADADVLSPFVLVESAEEGEFEECDAFALLTNTESCVLAFEATYAIQIAEECQFDRARHRKSHLLRGPPSV